MRMAGSPHAGNGEGPRKRDKRPPFDRKRALLIALDLFWRHGFAGVSIADLTAKIGIAPPSLYHAFGSKAGLFREVVELYQGGGLSDADILNSPSSFEATRLVLERAIATVASDGNPRGCVITCNLLLAPEDHGEMALYLRAERAKLRIALQKRIQRDIDHGVFREEVNAETLSRFYISVLQGFAVQAVDGATAAELANVMKTALQAWPKEKPRTKAPARRSFRKALAR